MMYFPTIKTAFPRRLTGLATGQWIDFQGARGRYVGRGKKTIWIAWGKVACDPKLFKIYCDAFKNRRY
jgi:hypothetical protein